MSDILPGELFRKSLTADSKLRSFLCSDEFQSAVVHSLVSMQMDGKATTEELNGARKFVSILSTIADPPAPPAAYPTKRLVEPSREPPKEKKKA